MLLTKNVASKSNWPVERPRITYLFQTCANNQNRIFCSPLLQQVPGRQQPASGDLYTYTSPAYVVSACICIIQYTILFIHGSAAAVSMAAVDTLSHTNPHNICSIQHSTYASVALPPLLLTI